jgi:Tfp pilus assembly protein PilO
MNRDKSFLTRIYRNKYFALPLYFAEKRNQKISTLIFTFLSLSFFGLFAISPTLSTIAQLQKQLVDNKIVDQKLQEKINNIALLNQQYSQLKPDIPVILETLPTAPNVALFMGQVQTVARTTNVSLSNLQTFEVDLSQSNLGTDVSSFVFAFTASGTYDDVSKFIKAVISFNRLVSIDAVSIAQSSGGITSMSLRGKAYYKQ